MRRRGSKTVMVPEELMLRRVLLPTETNADPTSTPAVCSTSSTAWRTASVTPPCRTTSPYWTEFRDSACPTASTSSCVASSGSEGASGTRASTVRT